MSYWECFAKSGMGLGYLPLLAGFVVVAGVLALLVPGAQRRIGVSVGMFMLSGIVLLIAAGVLYRNSGEVSGLQRGLRGVGLILQAIALVNLGAILLFRVVLAWVRLAPPPILRDLLIGVAYGVAVVMVLSELGVNLTGLVATSAVVTAVLGFSMQDTLGNVMGGMSLQMERSIAVGDWVRVGEQEGMVKEIRWRHTSIETRNWDTVIFPNRMLMNSQVVVLGRRGGKPRQTRQWVYFNVDYRHPPTTVMEAVESALRAEPMANVAAEPLPQCILMDFKESWGAYAVRYWLTDLSATDPTNSQVRTRIYAALQRSGISLSIPAHSIFVTEEGQERKEHKREEEVTRRLGALRRVELFSPLNEAELRQLAEAAKVAPFVKGEAMTRQGATAHWLYVLVKGRAEVRISSGAEARKVAELEEGSFFGEMGLLTGEARSATVVALSDAVCYRVEKEALMAVMQKRPEIAEGISQILARRRAELEVVKGQAAAVSSAPSGAALLTKMRRFFGLGER